MKKKIIAGVLAGIMFTLSACGMSKENLAIATETRDSLTAVSKESDKLYGELTDESHKNELDELDTKLEEYNAIELKKVKDDEAEELIAGMKDLTASYESLNDTMKTEIEQYKAQIEEEAKYKDILCYIENKSGSELSGIIIKDISKGTESENLLFEGQTLPQGRILSGVIFTVYEESSQRQLITTDTLGNEVTYNLELSGISEMSESGISIKIPAPDNEITVGPYAAPTESDDTTEQSEENQE